MTRITQAEQILLLLRAHLQRTVRLRKKRTATTPSPERKAPLDRLVEVSEAQPNTVLARALVAGLLEEEFGAALAAEPRFQAMVDEIVSVIEKRKESRALLNGALTQLRNEK